MNVFRNLFYSFLIFAGILILTLIIQMAQHDRWKVEADVQLQLDKERLKFAAHGFTNQFKFFIREHGVALRCLANVFEDRAEFSSEAFLKGAAGARRDFPGIDAIQYISPDRQTVWTSAAPAPPAQRHFLPDAAWRDSAAAPRSDPPLERLLELARDEKRTLYTNALALPSGARGLLALLPIRGADGASAGWLAGVIRIDSIVESRIASEEAHPFILAIEMVIDQQRETLYGADGMERISSEHRDKVDFNLANQPSFDKGSWIVTLGLDASEERSTPGKNTLMILLLGLLISAIAGFFTFVILFRSDRLEVEVAEKVKDVRASQEELQAIIEGAPMAIMGYDQSNRIFLWNPMCEEIFGYLRDEAEGRLLGQMAATEAESGMIETLLVKSFEGQRLGRLSWRTRRKDGEIITCGGSLTTVVRSDADEPFVLLICNDITAQQQLRAELQRYTEHLEQMVKERTGELADSEARHRQLLSTAKDMIVGIDEHQRITLFNSAAERTFGYAADEILSQPIWTILPLSGAAGAKGGVEPFLRSGQTERVGITREMNGKRRQGELFPVEVSLSLFTRNDHPHFTAIIRDITERKEMDERIEQMIRDLRAANQEMEEFTYVVSHDMKAPLRAVKNLCQFLVEDCGQRLDETGRDYLRRLEESVTLMSALIDDLLELSQITRVKTKPVPVEVEAMIEKVIAILKPGASVQLSYARDLPSITCTAAKMEQVFLNLISNGIKYNDKDTIEIEIGFEEKEHHYQFYVRDNGIGIDKKYQQRIFQAFQRLHKRNEYEGTGIGLTIVRKVLQEHGGRIWMESELGFGATFFFTVPKIRVEEPVS